MDPGPVFDPSAFIGAGLAGIAIWLTLTAGAIALAIWITYTIIWRAVRRGLREYYSPAAPARRTGYLFHDR